MRILSQKSRAIVKRRVARYNTHMEFWGFTIGTVGKILIGLTAVLVHHRMLHEHKIDRKVFRTMKFEQKLALLGITMIIAGYLLELPSVV